jgi:hypothetical protein
MPGLVWAVHTRLPPTRLFGGLVIASFVLALYFLYASYQSSRLLARIREELLRSSQGEY